MKTSIGGNSRLRRLGLLAAAVAGLITVLASGCGKPASGAVQATGTSVSNASGQAADFTLTSIDGRKVTLSDLKGKVVLVNFWATWCPACKAEMPALEAAYEQDQARGLVVLAVDLREDSATVARFAKDNGLSFPIVIDADGQVSERYNVYYIPHTVIVDRDGKQRRVHVGAFSSKEDILSAVEPYLSAGG